MIKIILLIILIYSFWDPILGSTIFIVIATLFNLWLLLPLTGQYLGKIEPDKSKWTEEEARVIKKYYLYFRFPFASRANSSTASGIHILGSILIIWLLFNTFWLRAIILAINVIISALIAPRLNPRLFLHDAVEKYGKYKFHEEMIAVDSVCEKILKKQKESIEKKFKEKEDGNNYRK